MSTISYAGVGGERTGKKSPQTWHDGHKDFFLERGQNRGRHFE